MAASVGRIPLRDGARKLSNNFNFELAKLTLKGNNKPCGAFLGARYASASVGAAAASSSSSSKTRKSSSIEGRIVEYLKSHYLEASKMQPPPKINPPQPFVVIKGSLDTDGPVLSRYYNQEEIKVSVLRLGQTDDPDESDAENMSQIFLMVVITKGDEGPALHFLCDLYPDAMGIQSVSLRDRKALADQTTIFPKGYQGPDFQDLDRELQKAFRLYLDERGINEGLFRFLQTWLYVKEHRHLVQWLKTVGTFITKPRIPVENC